MMRRLLMMAVLMGVGQAAGAERLKDLATLMGSRSNQLMGFGLVVGLPNMGDDMYQGVGQQTVASMLRHLGINVGNGQQLLMRNVAVVMVTADLPAYTAPGQRLDVTVSSMGNARSLQGGTLVLSALKGPDMKVYAMAQGQLSVGGYFGAGLSGSNMQKNVTTVGRIPNGAVVEREVPVEMPSDQLAITLHQPDFTTAVRIAAAIDAKLKTVPTGPAPAGGAAANPNAPVPTNTPFAEARSGGTVMV
ncbi:MAG: flagellar biosynthesis protein FlgI, partial [Deltaproteobacteria bacterium]